MEDIQQLFRETIAEFMESGLDAEMDEQLGYDRYDVKGKETDDSRNGHSRKTLRTSFGDTTIQIPRDRYSMFKRFTQVLQAAIVTVCRSFAFFSAAAADDPNREEE